MNERAKKGIFYILAGATAVFLLWISFRGVQWSAFIQALAQCRWSMVLLAMLAGLASFWLRGLRWRALIYPIDPSISRMTVFNAINISYLANLLLPRVGEIVRCGYITADSKKEADGTKKASFDKVLGTAVLERGWDMVTMLFLLGLLLAFKWKEFGNFFMVQMWEPIAASLEGSRWAGIIAILIVAILAVAGVFIFRKKGKIFSKVAKFFSGMLKGFASCLKMKNKWMFLLQTALIWLMYWSMSYFTLLALSSNPMVAPLGGLDALFLMMVGSLSTLVPVPGGFGAFHFIVKAALSGIYGIPGAMAIVFATLSHESQAIMQAICGLFSFLWESFKKKDDNQ